MTVRILDTTARKKLIRVSRQKFMNLNWLVEDLTSELSVDYKVKSSSVDFYVSCVDPGIFDFLAGIKLVKEFEKDAVDINRRKRRPVVWVLENPLPADLKAAFQTRALHAFTVDELSMLARSAFEATASLGEVDPRIEAILVANPNALLQLANRLLALDRKAEAIDWLTRAVAQLAMRHDCHRTLFKLLVEKGDHDRAMAVATRAANLAPLEAGFLHAIIRLETSRNRLEDVAMWQRKLALLDKDAPLADPLRQSKTFSGPAAVLKEMQASPEKIGFVGKLRKRWGA